MCLLVLISGLGTCRSWTMLRNNSYELSFLVSFLFIVMTFCRFLSRSLFEFRFIYAFQGVGITTLLITCTGHIAAETGHNFCLSCVSSSNDVICSQIFVHLIFTQAIYVFHKMALTRCYCFV